MPPIMRIDVEDHNGEIDVKSAYLPGYSGIAIKVSAGFFDNPKQGLPSLGGFMMVLDSETGMPAAALFDNGYLTDFAPAWPGRWRPGIWPPPARCG
jgi:ornithine cyclodeaminase/alanine dehydrogenase-like protein (mu-crystallin family)